MKNAITKMFPGLTRKRKERKNSNMRNKLQLARITGLSVKTVSRYLSAAGVTADEFRKISSRNGHDQSYYNLESQNKFFDWLCGPRDCSK